MLNDAVGMSTIWYTSIFVVSLQPYSVSTIYWIVCGPAGENEVVYGLPYAMDKGVIPSNIQ